LGISSIFAAFLIVDVFGKVLLCTVTWLFIAYPAEILFKSRFSLVAFPVNGAPFTVVQQFPRFCVCDDFGYCHQRLHKTHREGGSLTGNHTTQDQHSSQSYLEQQYDSGNVTKGKKTT